MRILIVDDNEDIRALVSNYVRKWGHEPLTAEHGLAAWEVLQETEIGFMISDWSMPEISGVELCRRVREHDFGRYIYIILLTAKGHKADLIEGLEAGADDFVVKPFNKEELKVRIRAGERVLQLEKDLAERNAELRYAYETISKDLESAARLQQSLLPDPKRFTASTFGMERLYMPAAFIGGDTLNVITLDAQHIGLYLIDVAGHGIPSAMTSVTLHKMLSTIGNDASLLTEELETNADGAKQYRIRPPGEVVAELNNRWQSEHDAMQYFTMIYAVLNTETGVLKLCQAGHPEPILLRANGETLTFGSGNVPVGMLPDMVYDEDEITMTTDDRLFFYSDGITECANHTNELFGVERLMTALQSSRGASLKESLAEVDITLRLWRNVPQFDDDISILAIEKR